MMDWSNVMTALGQGARPGSALLAAFQKPQQDYTQQPVPPMSQPMYQNSLGNTQLPTAPQAAPAQAADPTQAPGVASAPGMPGAQQQHGVFGNLVRMFAGGA